LAGIARIDDARKGPERWSAEFLVV